MIRWHRRPEEANLQNTKRERLGKYKEICGEGHPQVPELLTSKLP